MTAERRPFTAGQLLLCGAVSALFIGFLVWQDRATRDEAMARDRAAIRLCIWSRDNAATQDDPRPAETCRRLTADFRTKYRAEP